VPHKDLKFAVTLIAIVAVVAIVAFVYAQQSFLANQPSASPQPNQSPTDAPTEGEQTANPSAIPETSQTPQTTENPQATASAQPTATPEPGTTEPNLTVEQIRSAIMTYIRTSHNQTINYMPTAAWTGGHVDSMGVGSEKYSYLNQNWNVTLQYPVVPNAVYTVTADYSPMQGASVAQPTIAWKGTWQSGVIIETSYSFS
jgi:hypothetical protein